MIREATHDDIPQIQIVHNAVKENMLPDPALVTDTDCSEFLFERGKGWVCEINGRIVGFAIADLKENNIWALFVHPDFDRRGIGRRLHDVMLDWYFSQTETPVWLGTAPGTRAEGFYAAAGWQRDGMYGKEVKFTMDKSSYTNR